MQSSNEHGGNIFSIASQLGISTREISDFSASINPLGLSQHVRDALVNALDSLVHYPDNSCRRLKQALARTHGLATSQIELANGSTEIIYKLPSMLYGRRALVIEPAFSEYVHALKQHGWDVRQLTLSSRNNFRLDPERIGEALIEGYDALYLCNPGNPSGILYPRELIQKIYGMCRSAHTFFILDEAFMDFCEEHSAKQIITAEAHGVVLRSMTKFHAIPGLRLGYAMASQRVIGRLAAIGGPWSVNTMAQEAGLAALNDREYIQRSTEYVATQRTALSEQLAALPGLTVYPSSANFLLVSNNGGITSAELQGRLLKKRILIRDCARFAGLSNRFFRVAVRTEEENIRLVDCLREALT